MAIDSRDKRSSAIDVGIPFRRKYPVADSAINAADRQHSADMYRGILAGGAPVAPSGGDYVPTYRPRRR